MELREFGIRDICYVNYRYMVVGEIAISLPNPIMFLKAWQLITNSHTNTQTWDKRNSLCQLLHSGSWRGSHFFTYLVLQKGMAFYPKLMSFLCYAIASHRLF